MALFSYFGIGAAAGVVVNDNLVLIDYVRRLEREGLSSPEAIVTSAVSRFRPIFLTTVTTFVGLIPIMAEQSTSAQFLKPAVLSGLWRVLCAVCQSVAGTRHVFSGSRLAAMAGRKKGPPFNGERCSRGDRALCLTQRTPCISRFKIGDNTMSTAPPASPIVSNCPNSSV